MTEQTPWSIGAADGRAPELIDNYRAPTLLGDVVWRVPPPGKPTAQRWPIYQPSEADPEAGYRLHPYTVEFELAGVSAESYALRIHYLVIAPRLPYLELAINGHAGRAYLRPVPSESGEIRLLSGLHTTIYSEGVAEVIIPGSLLRQGPNVLRLVARDDGEVVLVENREAINRLDRMANGAGLIYQLLTLVALE